MCRTDSKVFRQALDALKVETTALLVEAGRDGNRNLTLSSRNLDGVELVNSSAVHPYHLLRYDRAIFRSRVSSAADGGRGLSRSRSGPEPRTIDALSDRPKLQNEILPDLFGRSAHPWIVCDWETGPGLNPDCRVGRLPKR